jgi:hypothetical protein
MFGVRAGVTIARMVIVAGGRAGLQVRLPRSMRLDRFQSECASPRPSTRPAPAPNSLRARPAARQPASRGAKCCEDGHRETIPLLRNSEWQRHPLDVEQGPLAFPESVPVESPESPGCLSRLCAFPELCFRSIGYGPTKPPRDVPLLAMLRLGSQAFGPARSPLPRLTPLLACNFATGRNSRTSACFRFGPSPV